MCESWLDVEEYVSSFHHEPSSLKDGAIEISSCSGWFPWSGRSRPGGMTDTSRSVGIGRSW